MPGLSKKTSFAERSAPGKKGRSADLADNPHVSAFLSPKSRIFTGGHGYGGNSPHANPSYPVPGSVSANAFSVSGKQLTPEEVAQKIASMLKPGPPFFSRVSNADLIDFISDASIMNCDKLRAAAAQIQAKKQANRAMTAFVPSGTVARRVAEEERWTGVGTVWSSLESLPAGAGWSRIPGTPGSTASTADAAGLVDDGLWSSLTLTVDLDCTTVSLAKSVVVPTQVLDQNHFFNGNAQSLFDDIGAGIKYKFDQLVTAGSQLKHRKEGSSSSGKGAAPSNYLSLSAYTDPASFSAAGLNIKWPSWMPWANKNKSSCPGSPDASNPTNGGNSSAGGQKRIWIPSSTKVSVHASWWGYNIYLPQPVIDSLEDDVDEAEKIANLINKCLTFMLNNIPAGLPTALGTVITILKAIAPTTGYISTFIGWSWDTIKSFNKGQGVVLSATWILPVALIPRSWDAPTNPASSTPATPTTPAAPVTAPTTGTSGGVQGTGMPMRMQDTTTPVAAPGATLPPADPTTVPIDLSAPAANDTSKAAYPGDALGRGNDATTSGPMGSTPAPAGQVPIDAES
ncbi:hypothetical protein BCV70DRAFT_22043 [Testicularia cyperi]|uniref:Uncharacterized protein n=1 Tax=Testicularia cyperi TaxID=1882483 RepID=A0A317XZI5_9BASI|nr:hypothetical protein BCV70DRAFT_22043 [Testicularia cyperi]